MIKRLIICVLLFTISCKEKSRLYCKNYIYNESKSINNENLFNKKLVGLSVVNKKSKNPYKKYGLSFSTVCYCDSPAIYIDKNPQELIIFNYCESSKSLKKNENKYVYKIEKILNEKDQLQVFTNNLNITFKKDKQLPFYHITIKGIFPTNYVGSQVEKIYTDQPEKFYKEDCGDFQG